MRQDVARGSDFVLPPRGEAFRPPSQFSIKPTPPALSGAINKSMYS